MRLSADEMQAWMELYMTEGLGNIGCRKLLEEFEDPKKILQAKMETLAAIPGVGPKCARNILRRKFASDPRRELEKVKRSGSDLLVFLDSRYPPLLKEIHDPPVLLYQAGKEIPTDQIFVAVVGSRNATYYGLKVAEKIGFGLASRGVGVVSGLARGIDAAAHWGCLRGNGFTIGVLGTGIDVVYPPSNRKLFRKVREQGTLLSEFPTGTPPEPRNFPIRNRIISGLSTAVVVVEATKRSGSLITAGLALDQGRDVFAVPGSIDSFKSTGTHSLIKQGAKLVENSEDVIQELGLDRTLHRNAVQLPAETASAMELDESERKIYEIIGQYPIHIDEIVRRSRLQPAEVASTLLKMELKAMVKQLPGKMFVR